MKSDHCLVFRDVVNYFCYRSSEFVSAVRHILVVHVRCIHMIFRFRDFKIVPIIFSLSGCPIAAMGKLVQTTQQTAKKSGLYLPCCMM